MGLFGFGRKKSEEAVVGLYGKHRSSADFLRLNASSSEIRAFDEWLSSALPAAARLVPDWEATYHAAPPVYFLYRAAESSRRAIVGGLAPSADPTGRLYPLIVFAELDASLVLEHYSALPFESLIEEVGALLERRTRLSREALFEAVREIRPPDVASFGAAAERRDSYLDRTAAAKAFAAILPPAANGERSEARALGVLREACAEVVPGRLPGFGVRCPLGSSAAGRHAALWLAFAGRLLPAETLPLALWSGSALLLYFSRPSTKALAALWRPGFQDDSLYELAAEPEKPPLSGLPDPGQPLRELLASLSPSSRR
jgi:type VI secretion system ImpM family protein